jgi:holo-[acyl-carrier protein] synthase
MLSCGIDIVELGPFSRLVEMGGDEFLQRLYTQQELSYSRGRVPQLAARLAAKEACAKALGTGIRGVSWQDMEVLRDRRGKPVLRLSGSAARRVEELRVAEWTLSLSHSDSLAIALVVMTGDGFTEVTPARLVDALPIA